MARATKASVEVEGKILHFTFATEPPQLFSVDTEQFIAEIRERAELHGFEQKLRDSYAGKDVTPEIAVGMFLKVYEPMQGPTGVWSTRGTGEPRESGVIVLAEALVAFYADRPEPVDFATAKAKVESMDRSARSKLRKVPAIAQFIAERTSDDSAMDMDSLF